MNYLHFPGEDRPESPNDEYVSLKRATQLLGLSAQKLYELLRNGNLSEVRTIKYDPGVIAFRLSDLLDYRDDHALTNEEKKAL